jgi:hypothetical protein
MDLFRYVKRLFLAIGILCLVLSQSACRERYALNDIPLLEENLRSLLQDLSIKPSGSRQALKKDSIASIGVDFTGSNDVSIVADRLTVAASKAGFDRKSEPRVSGSQVAIYFCHRTKPYLYVTWTLMDREHAVLSLTSEGVKGNRPSCAVEHP